MLAPSALAPSSLVVTRCPGAQGLAVAAGTVHSAAAMRLQAPKLPWPPPSAPLEAQHRDRDDHAPVALFPSCHE